MAEPNSVFQRFRLSSSTCIRAQDERRHQAVVVAVADGTPSTAPPGTGGAMSERPRALFAHLGFARPTLIADRATHTGARLRRRATPSAWDRDWTLTFEDESGRIPGRGCGDVIGQG